MEIEIHTYREGQGVDATIDGARMSIPEDPANRHWQMIKEWEAEGNILPPYQEPPQSMADYENAIQSLVDTTATEKSFRDGVTLASYTASTIPAWAAEAAAFVAWRDHVWAYAYAELAKVQAGQREQPDTGAFIAEIAPIVWPD